MGCGRVRKPCSEGFSWLVDGELDKLKVGRIYLKTGKSVSIKTEDMEYGGVLVYGKCQLISSSGNISVIGPRTDPFTEKAYGFLYSKDETVQLTALNDTLIIVGAAKAETKKPNAIITPDMNGGGKRGSDNWERYVRFVVWNDNTEANMIMLGETIVHSGNWATMPPHRHQFYIPEIEVNYDEAYVFHFSKNAGFALARLFDEDMDEAYSLIEGDVLYTDRGYHPVVCVPGSSFYQVTLMSGKYRISKASIHPDFVSLLDSKKMDNPYADQRIK